MLIGQPNKIEDFKPFTPEELQALRAPVVAALQGGAPPNAGAAVEIGVIARFFATIDALQASGEPVPPERPKLIIPGDGY